jgi:hypothetical protein
MSTVRATWQQIDNLNDSGKNELSYISLGLSRLISPHLFGYLEFRHLQQDSDASENSYDENRVTASLLVAF